MTSLSLRNGATQTLRLASFGLVQSVMAGTALFCSLAALRCAQGDVVSNCLGAIVNTVAFMHYQRLYPAFAKGENVITIRFSDWLATLPLMVFELHSALKAPLLSAVPGAFASAIMVVSGFWATPFAPSATKIALVVMSFVCLAVVYGLGALQFGDDTTSNVIVSIFAGVWTAYGLVFLPNGDSDVAFNVLDVVSKCGLALTVAVRSL